MMVCNIRWPELDERNRRFERAPGKASPFLVFLAWIGGRWILREE